MREMTAILANGEFPRQGGKAWTLMASAARIVACDGAGARLKALAQTNLPPVFKRPSPPESARESSPSSLFTTIRRA